MGVKLTLDKKLFTKLTENLPSIPQEMQQVAEKAIRESGGILEKGLREQVTNDDILSVRAKKRLIHTLRPTEIMDSTVIKVKGELGWKFDNTDNPKTDDGRLSQYLNYGTVERYTKDGRHTGKITGAQFLNRALRKKTKQMKTKQKDIIESYIKTLFEE